MRALPEMVTLLGVVMVLPALALPCQRQARDAIRLIALQSVTLAAATAMIGLASGAYVLLVLALIILATKAIALPWLLRRLAPTTFLAPDQHDSILPILMAGTGLIGLAWLAAPSLPSGMPFIAPALAMVLLGLLPGLFGQPALARLLGLLGAENGIMLAAIHVPGPARPFLLQLTALGLIVALLSAVPRDARAR